MRRGRSKSKTNPTKNAERLRKWRAENPEKAKADNERRRLRRDKWKQVRWYRIARYAQQRCEYPKNRAYEHYSSRGIKFKLTVVEIAKVWFRDKAYMLDQPEMDRIDPMGHYEIGNIQFITKAENLKRREFNKLEEAPF